MKQISIGFELRQIQQLKDEATKQKRVSGKKGSVALAKVVRRCVDEYFNASKRR